jgi:N-acetylneuraminate synthase/N,N'-diacetyllegionaminate synthase
MHRHTLIIAEAGVNYNNFDEAKRLVEMAAFAGTDVIKFQIFWALGRLKEYELSRNQWKELCNFAHYHAVGFMATAHCNGLNKDTVDFVDSLVRIHKIASPYLTNKEYIKYIASKGKPILLSTGSLKHKDGMAKMKEIKQALSWMPKADVTLLHCVSKYPCKNPHYKRILQLKKFKKPVGLSDHSLNTMIQCWPVVEKHFKVNDNCVDSNVSLDPNKFREMVRNIRNHELIFKYR